MRELYQLALSRVKRYRKAKDGATAIEFALLAIPFFMLLFAILELAVIFFLSSTLSHAVSEAGRLVRVGSFQNCSQAAFKAEICSRMNAIGSCENSLRVDLISEPTFSAVTLPGIPVPPSGPAGSPPPPIPDGDFDQTTAGDPVVLRALFYHKLLLPPQLTRLENIPGSKTRVLASTTAFRNEPFPTQACPSGSPAAS